MEMMLEYAARMLESSVWGWEETESYYLSHTILTIWYLQSVAESMLAAAKSLYDVDDSY